jgi:hypothetical protein
MVPSARHIPAEEIPMKLFSVALLGATMALTTAWAGSAMAQDKKDMPMRDKPAMHRMTRHHSYQWNYKSEAEEHQATEDLNRQYRGVPAGDHH